MSEKDSISSQGIPVVVRALGALALAAATAVAIRWFISRDTKEEKPEGHITDHQKDQHSAAQDGPFPYEGLHVHEKVPPGNTNLHQVSDGCELKLLLDCYQGSGCCKHPSETLSISQYTLSDQENGERIAVNISGEIRPSEGTKLAPVFCKLNNVNVPCASVFLFQTEDSCNASVLAAPFREGGSYTTESMISSGCLTDRCDNLYRERSESIEEPEWRLGTSSSYGECIDHLDYSECLECQDTCIGQDCLVAETCMAHKTVDTGFTNDNLSNETDEKDVVLNCQKEINAVKLTNSSDENKYIISDSLCGYQDDVVILTNGQTELACGPLAVNSHINSNTDAYIPDCHRAPMGPGNAIQLETNTSIENDSLHCANELSDFEQALITVHGNAVSNKVCEDITQNTVLHSKQDNEMTDLHQLVEGQKLLLYNGNVTGLPLRHVTQDPVHSALLQLAGDDDYSDTRKIIHLTEKNTNYNDNYQQFSIGINVETVITSEPQANVLLSSPCVALEESHHSNLNSKILPLSQRWSPTKLHSSAENSDLMLQLDLQGSDISSDALRMECKHQLFVEENSTTLHNRETAESENLTAEKTMENLDVGGENTGSYCTASNAPYALTTLGTIMRDSISRDAINSAVVTKSEFISSVKTVNYGKEHTEVENRNPFADAFHVLSVQERCHVITNGCLNSSHKPSDDNSDTTGSKIAEKPGNCCDKDHNKHHPSKLYSILQNNIFPTGDSFLSNPYTCEDDHIHLPAMGTNTSQQSFDKGNYAFKDIVNVGRKEEFTEVEDLFCPSSNFLEQGNLKDTLPTDSNLCSTQDQDKCLEFDEVMHLSSEDIDDISLSREKIMSTIAENPELILPEYQSKSTPVKKLPLMARSCDNILSGQSQQRFTLKNKARSMLCLLTEYYSSKLTSSENEPVEEVARGSFICIPKGLQNIGEAMRFQLTLGNCLELLNLARKNSVPELLKAVYTVISDNYLNVLKNTAVYGQLTSSERERVLQLRMRGRSSLCVVETKSIFGLNKNVRCSVETAECKIQLFSLNIETNQWKPLTKIPEEACLKGCSICSMHNYLFIAGGLQKTMDGSSCSNKLFCYNPLTDIWTPLSPMNEGRSQLRLIPLDGYLYAIGGECLNTVEKYDPRTNKWTFVAPLPKGSFAVAHEAAACGGEIYISGGHLFYRLFKYNPVRDEWAECPFNASKGRSCDMVSVGNILYRFDMHKDSSVNILKYNTVAKMWSEYTAIFPGSKIPFRCVLLDGSIYCLNRETTAKFLMEDDKPEFEAHVFTKVPTRGVGSPYPIVLCLPGTVPQTSV